MSKKPSLIVAKLSELVSFHKVRFPECEINSSVNVRKAAIYQAVSKFNISVIFTGLYKSGQPLKKRVRVMNI